MVPSRFLPRLLDLCYLMCMHLPHSRHGCYFLPWSLGAVEHWGNHLSQRQILQDRHSFCFIIRCNLQYWGLVIFSMFFRICHYFSFYLSIFLWFGWCSWPLPLFHGLPYRLNVCYTEKVNQRRWLGHLTALKILHITTWACILILSALWTKDFSELNLPLFDYQGCKLAFSLSDLVHLDLRVASVSKFLNPPRLESWTPYEWHTFRNYQGVPCQVIPEYCESCELNPLHHFLGTEGINI